MPELVYQSISPSFFAPSITLLVRSSGLSFSSERQISSAAGTTAEKVLVAEAPASKKAHRKIGSLHLVKFISWQRCKSTSRTLWHGRVCCQTREAGVALRLDRRRNGGLGFSRPGTKPDRKNIAVTASRIEFRSKH